MPKIKKYLVVFGAPYDDQKEAEERAQQLSAETNYEFYVQEVEEEEEAKDCEEDGCFVE